MERSLAESRQKAQALILAGQIYIGEKRVEKPGQLLAEEAPLDVRGPKCPFVSRGGMKLLGALEDLGIGVQNLDCLDVGASTGGFTDCLLQRGAQRVVALDVGHGQLDARLRGDPRVTLLEGVNARRLEAQTLPFEPELVVVDASFISLKLLLPAILPSAPKAAVIALVKPQFEVGRGRVGRGGVVRSEEDQRAAVEGIAAAARLMGYTVAGVAKSRLKGPKGNQEHFLYLIPSKKGARQ